MDEIWKEHPYYVGMLTSNLGRIKLPESEARMPHGGFRKYTTKPTIGSIMKSKRGAKHSYRGFRNRKLGTLKVHQLICETFHGMKPFPNAVVIHIDEDALNNNSSNLKWGTQKENLNSPKFIDYCKSRTGENSPTAKSRLTA